MSSTSPGISVASATTDVKRLDSSMVRALAWTGAVRWPTQVLMWLCTLVVARILTPGDYGLVGMATVYLGLVSLINEFGIGSAVITLRDFGEDRVAQLNSLSLVLGLACCVVSCAVAIPLGRFFAAPRLPAIVVVMSLGFLISAFLTVPDAVLQKELRFKFLAQVEVIKALVQALAMLGMALLGMGYWTLVLGPLTGIAAATAVTLAACRCGLAVPRLSSLKPALSYSRDILILRLAWYWYSNADFLVAGRVLGAVPLGAYTMAWTLANIPVDKITTLVARVSHAFFSAVQNENADLCRYLLNLTEGIALITFPASVGLFLEAQHMITLLLGTKWLAAVVPLQLLSLYVSVRSITTLLPTVLNVRRYSRFVVWNTLAAAVFFPAAFFLGSHWGTTGIAAAWIVCYPFYLAPLYRKVFHVIELPLVDYVRSLWPAFSGSLALVVAVLALRMTLPWAWPLALRTAVEILAAVLVYVMLFLVLHRDRLRRYYATIRTLRK
jgi:O-antigen/teichoic acid export membrane protein